MDGAFSVCLLLTCTGTQETISGNATTRINYTLSYITQPEQQTQADIQTALDTIHDALVDYLGGLSTYADMGGAVYLSHNIRQWAMEFEAQSSTFVLGFDIVAQL